MSIWTIKIEAWNLSRGHRFKKKNGPTLEILSQFLVIIKPALEIQTNQNQSLAYFMINIFQLQSKSYTKLD